VDDRASGPRDGGMNVGRARVVVAGVAWLLVVAGASLVTWTVIDAAGRDVVDVSAEQGSASPHPESPSAAPTTEPTTSERPQKSPRPRVASWEGAAGSVAVRCRGPVASLASATPADGWAVEVADRGPDRVEVELRRDEPDGRVQVRSECVRGIPRLTIDTTSESADDPASPSAPSGSGADDSTSGSNGSGGGDHGRDDGTGDAGSDSR
jgi:hypothetical protein